tara:strand:- start:33 stop:404 length:372 start_codon:yes stop_codon:yes gene_type:complete
MDANTGRPDHIEDVLVKLHTGQWFGWSDSKDKVYSNLVIHDDQYSKPSKASLEAGLVQAQDDFDWAEVRKKRDMMLSESDFILMPDYPLEDKSAWESYRQELRDIPSSFDDVNDVSYPEKPNA